MRKWNGLLCAVCASSLFLSACGGGAPEDSVIPAVEAGGESSTETASGEASGASEDTETQEITAESVREQGEILVQMERQSNAMEHMSESIGRVEKKVNSIDDRVAELEKEPGEKWKKIGFEIIKYLVLAAIGAVAGYLISKI